MDRSDTYKKAADAPSGASGAFVPDLGAKREKWDTLKREPDLLKCNKCNVKTGELAPIETLSDETCGAESAQIRTPLKGGTAAEGAQIGAPQKRARTRARARGGAGTPNTPLPAPVAAGSPIPSSEPPGLDSPPRHSGFSEEKGGQKRLTPARSIRAFCYWCSLESYHEIRHCPAGECPLHPLRLGRRVKGRAPLKLIRARCLDCTGFESGRVRTCSFGPEHSDPCLLWPYRFGRRPQKEERLTP